MPLSVECSQCHRAYRLDEKLAGQKVRCKQCGAAISVPAGGVTGSGLEPRAATPPPSPEPDVPDLRALFGPTPARNQTPEISVIDEGQIKAHRRRWVRKAGNPLLESIDELIKGAVLLALLAGIIVWLVRIYQSPQGLSVTTALPVLVVTFIIAAAIAPLAALAINAAVRTLKLAPREDTYGRVAAASLLPLAAALLAGWPGLGGSLDGLTTLAWILGPALLLYFLRAQLVEWLISVAAAAAGIAAGLLAANLLAMLAATAFGPLYADMLPTGPWVALAGGHSPAVAIPTKHELTAAETEPSSGGAVTSAGPGGSDATSPSPAQAAGNGTPDVKPPDTQLAMNNPPGGSPTTAPGGPVAPSGPPRSFHSPYLSSLVIGDPRLQGVRTFAAGATPNGTMLVARTGQNTETVERWNVEPLELRGSATFPFYPRRPNGYALNARGDVLAALCYFPRNELDVVSFDGKTPRKIFPLEAPAGVTMADPSIVCFSEAGWVCVRWDGGGATALEIWNTLLPPNQAPRRVNLSEAAGPMPGAIVFSPNVRTIAVYGRDGQISVYDMSAVNRLQRISHFRPTDLACKFIDMVFSPDGAEIALYSLVADVPTIMSFKVATGRPVCNTVLSSQNPGPHEVASASCRALLWMQIAPGKSIWLADGNLLIDSASGNVIATLGLSNVLDEQWIAGDWLALGFRAGTDGLENLVLGKIDLVKIRETMDKGK